MAARTHRSQLSIFASFRVHVVLIVVFVSLCHNGDSDNDEDDILGTGAFLCPFIGAARTHAQTSALITSEKRGAKNVFHSQRFHRRARGGRLTLTWTHCGSYQWEFEFERMLFPRIN